MINLFHSPLEYSCFFVLFLVWQPQDKSPIVLNPYGDDETSENENNDQTQEEEPSPNEEKSTVLQTTMKRITQINQAKTQSSRTTVAWVFGCGILREQATRIKLCGKTRNGCNIICIKVADGSASCTSERIV